MHTVSFAVTAYHEMSSPRLCGERLLNCISAPQQHPQISEIVIFDDGSSDYEALAKMLHGKPKVRLLHRNENYGVWGNKIDAVLACESDIVINCDSDNVMSSEYLDRAIETATDPNVRYSPSFAMPEFDYRHLCGTYDSDTISNLLSKPLGECCMNTGNQVTFRKPFEEVFGKLRGPNPHLVLPNLLALTQAQLANDSRKWRAVYNATDSFFFNAVWLWSGRSIEVVEGLHYSHYYTGGQESNYVRAPMEKGLLANNLAIILRAGIRKTFAEEPSRD